VGLVRLKNIFRRQNESFSIRDMCRHTILILHQTETYFLSIKTLPVKWFKTFKYFYSNFNSAPSCGCSDQLREAHRSIGPEEGGTIRHQSPHPVESWWKISKTSNYSNAGIHFARRTKWKPNLIFILEFVVILFYCETFCKTARVDNKKGCECAEIIKPWFT